MAESIAIFASINFAIVGLSHVFQVQAWRSFFLKLHSMGDAGALANGMITLLMGSLIVSFHNVWTGVPMLLTLIGWAYIVKATAIFIYPTWSLRSMKSVQDSSPLKLRIAGAALLGVAITILYSVLGGHYA